MNTKNIGKLGEELALKYLKNKGYKILDTNFERRIKNYKRGEIDIIALKDETLTFFEVKTSKSKSFLPEERITSKKLQRIKQTLQKWLLENKVQFKTLKIEALIINLDLPKKKAYIKHLKDLEI